MAIIQSDEKVFMVSNGTNTTYSGSTSLKAMQQWYTMQDVLDTVGPGSAGPQGVQGIPGTPGAVGPAGLNWQGAWVSGTSYVADDAVGYDGASWFCILATSGTTAPDLATANWALLASQGAQGIQGVQGPTGAQGPAGSATAQTNGIMYLYPGDSPYQTLSYDINRINLSSGSSAVHLPASAPIGKEISVFLETGTNVLTMYGDATLNLPFPFVMGAANQQTGVFTIFSSESYVFISLGSGLWKVNTISRTIMSGSAARTLNTSSTINGSSVSVQNSLNSDSVIVNTNNVRFGKNSGGLKTITLQLPTTVSANRVQSLPDADGTIALTSDITGAQVTKVLKTIVTSAQVLQLFTTPITVLPTASSGKVNVPINIHIKRNSGTAYTLNTIAFTLLDGLNIDTQTQINPNPLTNTSAGYMNNTIYLADSVSGSTSTGPYKLKANGGNPTLGTGDLDVYVTYIEITL